MTYSFLRDTNMPLISARAVIRRTLQCWNRSQNKSKY